MAKSIRAAATPLRSWINDRGLSTHVPTLKLAVLFLEGVAGLRRKTPMLTAAECRAHSEECVTLAKDPKISYARATILMAMSRNWTALAGQRDRYDALVREGEGK
jgi:hypothetical protein